MLQENIFRPPLNDKFKQKPTGNFNEDTHTHNFCLENKLTTDDYGRIAIKILKKFEHFLQQRKTFPAVKQIFVNIEDKHFKIECSAIENTSVN